jgi:hypothetical protein
MLPNTKSNAKSKTENVTTADRTKRHQMTQVLDIDISNARCHAHIKAKFVTAEIEELLTKKRAELEAAKKASESKGKSAKEDAACMELRHEINKITESIVRIGGDAPIAMATIVNYVAREMIKYTMDQTIAANRKIVDVGALHSGDMSRMPAYALIRPLPSITSFNPEQEEDMRRERAVANKLAKDTRESNRKAKDATETKATVAATKSEDEEEQEDQEERSNTNSKFNTYVDNVTKSVKQEEKYKSMRISNRLREVISQVVTELVASLSSMAKVAVLDLLQVRTLTAGHLKSIIRILYTHQLGECASSMEELLAYIDEKLKSYYEHNKTEKQRKVASQFDGMSDDVRTAFNVKQTADDNKRKVLRAESAKKKAIEATQKAKLLAAEVTR